MLLDTPTNEVLMLQYFDLYPQADERLQKHRQKMLGEQPYFHDDVIAYDSYIGSWTELGSGTRIMESTFGDYSYTAGDVSIIYADVGKFCSIASHSRINPGNHPTWRVTQHHMTYRRAQYGLGDNDTEFFQWRREQRCVIGHDVWMGHGALIMPGVSVGTGAVIGAGAVVTKNVEPFTVAVGVPAKPLRKRFPEAIVEALLRIAWWDWDRETLEARFDDLMNVEAFVEQYG